MSTTNSPSRGPVGTKYRTYKRATNKLAGWLVTTARLGAKVDRRHEEEASEGLKIRHFVSLTDRIIEATPRIEIPSDIIDIAKTAFLIRRERAIFLRGTDIDSDKRHQHVIDVIEEVYQKLKRHFQDSKQATKPEAKAVETSKAEDDLVPSFQLLDVEAMGSSGEEDGEVDKFDATAKTPLSKTNAKKKRQKQKKKAKQQAEEAEAIHLVEEDEDPYFVLICLLSDLKAMREYIKEVWQEYKEGKVDLITASLTTNATFDIIRTYEDDFPEVSSLLRDYSGTMRLILSRSLGAADDEFAFFFSQCVTIENFPMAHIRTVADMLEKIPDVADLVFATAFYFMHGPRSHFVRWRQLSHQLDANYRFDPFGHYEPEKNRAKMTAFEQFIEDIQILTSFAQSVYLGDQFLSLSHDHFTMQWRDEYSKSLDNTVTLATAFGAQLYLDIQHVLRQDAKLGVEELWENGTRIIQVIEEYKKEIRMTIHADEPHLMHMLKGIDTNLDVAWSCLTAALKLKLAKKILKPHTESSWAMRDQFPIQALEAQVSIVRFMEMNPTLCGIMLFQVVHIVRECASYLGMMWRSIMGAGQLYYGCQMHGDFWRRSAGSISSNCLLRRTSLRLDWETPLDWKDMDFLFSMVGKEAFFMGHLPKSNKEIVLYQGDTKDYWASLGLKKKRKCDVGDKGAFMLMKDDGSPVLIREDLFKGIFSYDSMEVTHKLFLFKYEKTNWDITEDSAVYSWTLEKLQRMLEDALTKEKQRSLKEEKQGRCKRKEERIATLKGLDGNVTQVSILRVLKETLQRESRALHFDYLSFHMTCLDLLRNIRFESRTILDELLGRSFRYNGLVYQDEHIVQWTMELQRVFNGINSAKEVFNTTNKGHVIIDETIKRYLIANKCKNREVKKIDSIRGIVSS